MSALDKAFVGFFPIEIVVTYCYNSTVSCWISPFNSFQVEAFCNNAFYMASWKGRFHCSYHIFLFSPLRSNGLRNFSMKSFMHTYRWVSFIGFSGTSFWVKQSRLEGPVASVKCTAPLTTRGRHRQRLNTIFHSFMYWASLGFDCNIFSPGLPMRKTVRASESTMLCPCT